MSNLLRSGLFILLLSSLVACAKTGYQVRIETESAKPPVLSELDTLLRDEGFEQITEKRRTLDDGYIREYWKDVSEKRHDYIYIAVFFREEVGTEPIQEFQVYIENEHNGLEPMLKKSIDELSDKAYRITLVHTLSGKEVVIERREVTSPHHTLHLP